MQVTVYAHPNSKVPRILERSPGIFDIYISESPQDGKANIRITKELAGYFDVAPSLVILKRGGSSKIKVFQIDV